MCEIAAKNKGRLDCSIAALADQPPVIDGLAVYANPF